MPRHATRDAIRDFPDLAKPPVARYAGAVSHQRAVLTAIVLSTASLAIAGLPRTLRWRWRLLLAATGAVLGVGIL